MDTIRSLGHSCQLDTAVHYLSSRVQTRLCRLARDQLRPRKGDRRDVSDSVSCLALRADMFVAVNEEYDRVLKCWAKTMSDQDPQAVYRFRCLKIDPHGQEEPAHLIH